MTIMKKVLIALTGLVVAGATAVGVGAAEAATYPNPGTVTGSINVHDPGIVKKPDGTYLIAHTGDNIVLKTSADRTAFRDAGAAFPLSLIHI